MKIRDLIYDLELEEIKGDYGTEVKGIAKDSRQIKEGYLFFMNKNNRMYLDDAKRRGASAIVTDMDESISIPCLIRVKDVDKAMGHIASRFLGEPSKYMCITGITGTNGKTTTCFLIESILRAAGKKVGLIGTVFYRYNGHVLKAKNTTPGAIELQKILKEMKDSETTHVTMEVSSHGLDQRRVEGVHFDICIFTNISHDHLDYHGDFTAYREAKSLLFKYYLAESCKAKKSAILNGDDPNVSHFIPPQGIATYFYGLKGDYEATVKTYVQDIDGMEVKISLMGEEIKARSSLIGHFNLYNLLAASLAGRILGVQTWEIKRGLERFSGVPGRMERVKNDRGYHIFIDYAHTPDALENVLKALSALKRGRLIVVFGCGGDRDREKRPLMGKIATSLADISIITSDNPRSEKPEDIIEDIKKGVSGSNYKEIVDRKEAIYEALRLMRSDDVLLIAGKGHEDYQIIGERIIHFSDREIVEEAINVGLQGDP